MAIVTAKPLVCDPLLPSGIPIPMDRHFTRRVPSSKSRRWRVLTVRYAAPERPAVHVYYSVDGRTPPRRA